MATRSIRSAGVQEGDHPQDAVVIVVGLREPQLGQDAAHVLFYRSLGCQRSRCRALQLLNGTPSWPRRALLPARGRRAGAVAKVG
jgi:hypothetical protein